MSAPLFNVVVKGVRDGFDSVIVKAQFSRLYKLDDAKVERVFKSTPILLRRNLEESFADTFVARLLTIGVAAEKVKVVPQSSKAIFIQDKGEISTDAHAMHQPVDFLYGENKRRIPLVFNGKGFSYCKLWLVNVLVCLLSLGVLYSWASLRSRRYFVQHSSLDRIVFDYNASLQKVYWLQLILVVYLLIMVLGFFYSHVYFFVGLILLLVALPYYWYKYNQFQCSHYYYGDRIFYRQSNLSLSYKILLVWPLLSILSLGLFVPYAAFKIQQSRGHKISFGHYEFSFNGCLKKYLILLPGLLIAEAAVLACILWQQYLPSYVCIAIVVTLVILLFVHWQLLLMHLQWNSISSRLGYFQFTGDLSSYSALMLKNIILCLLTVGLYWPWAKIHTAKYKVEHLAFFANQGFDKWRKKINSVPEQQ